MGEELQKKVTTLRVEELVPNAALAGQIRRLIHLDKVLVVGEPAGFESKNEVDELIVVSKTRSGRSLNLHRCRVSQWRQSGCGWRRSGT